MTELCSIRIPDIFGRNRVVIKSWIILWIFYVYLIGSEWKNIRWAEMTRCRWSQEQSRAINVDKSHEAISLWAPRSDGKISTSHDMKYNYFEIGCMRLSFAVNGVFKYDHMMWRVEKNLIDVPSEYCHSTQGCGYGRNLCVRAYICMDERATMCSVTRICSTNRSINKCMYIRCTIRTIVNRTRERGREKKKGKNT